MAELSLTNLLAAMALSYGGAHPWGHISEANKMGVPGKVDYRHGVEMYDQNAWNKLSPAEQARIHAAGFEGQQTFGNALSGSSMEDEMRLANALYKFGYAAGIKPQGTEGDLNYLEKLSGNRMTKSLLGASAATDLLGVYDPKRKWDLNFIAPEGAPGLMFKMRF